MLLTEPLHDSLNVIETDLLEALLLFCKCDDALMVGKLIKRMIPHITAIWIGHCHAHDQTVFDLLEEIFMMRDRGDTLFDDLLNLIKCVQLE